MEARWLVFGLLCLGFLWLVRGYFFATAKTTHRDRDHNLAKPPEDSTAFNGDPGIGHHH